jgi:nitrogen fixation protein FixH
VVANSYVASQGYDAERQAQIALGWNIAVHEAGGRLSVEINDAVGAPVRGLEVTATVGRPSSDVDDVVLTLAPDDAGYAVLLPHKPGLWRVDIQAHGQAGAQLRAHTEIYLKGA